MDDSNGPEEVVYNSKMSLKSSKGSLPSRSRSVNHLGY